MSWAIGFDPNWKRWVGYGVPAICDHPRCSAGIDRGLGYVCGQGVYGGEHGCGLFFCRDHLRHDGRTSVCTRCLYRKPPYQPKEDTIEWVRHLLTDGSWAQWRVENDDAVSALMARVLVDSVLA